MNVIHPVTGELAAVPEPREILFLPHGFLAAILLPLDLDALAENVRRGEGHRMFIRTTVVDIGAPADRLFGERLPAHENVVRRLAFENELEAGLQLPGRLESGVAAGLAGVHGGLLVADPVAEVRVGEFFEIGSDSLRVLSVVLPRTFF